MKFVVDIGCGKTLTTALEATDTVYVGIDINTSVKPELHCNYLFLCAEARCLPPQKQNF